MARKPNNTIFREGETLLRVADDARGYFTKHKTYTVDSHGMVTADEPHPIQRRPAMSTRYWEILKGNKQYAPGDVLTRMDSHAAWYTLGRNYTVRASGKIEGDDHCYREPIGGTSRWMRKDTKAAVDRAFQMGLDKSIFNDHLMDAVKYGTSTIKTDALLGNIEIKQIKLEELPMSKTLIEDHVLVAGQNVDTLTTRNILHYISNENNSIEKLQSYTATAPAIKALLKQHNANVTRLCKILEDVAKRDA